MQKKNKANGLKESGVRWGEYADMIGVPAQLTGDHLNGWRAEEVIILKSSKETHQGFSKLDP